MSQYLVYFLADPRSGEVRYVGLSKQIKKRVQQHCAIGSDNGTKEKKKWISELKNAGLSPEVVEVEYHNTKKDGANSEKEWISIMREGGCNLTNREAVALRKKSATIYIRFPDDIESQVETEHQRRTKAAGVDVTLTAVVLDLVKRGLKSLARSRKRSSK